MNSKIVIFFQYLYKYFLVSFYFWIYLLKGLVVYSLVPAISSLFSVLRDINMGVDDKTGKTVKQLYKQTFDKYKESKLTSFIYTFILIILYTGLFFFNKQQSQFSLMLTILFIYFLAMALLMLTYSSVFLSFKNMKIKDANMFAFVTIIKNIVGTVAILVVVGVVYFIADYNFLAFIIFGPFIYGLGVIFSLYKLIEE